ncbi:hypothetical protein AM588_10007823 [Phytophthora nicotianae]|uniref:Translin-associated factor X-interacting protein 1 N-terminal domain-containing protein n=1 Tax=Phytophthora nicotianae TaxID=4792 RepID=A0A0W8D8T2_PHYNI|nr:hypothetical protein AM588_10007823 [Phytophthora nicotianae]
MDFVSIGPASPPPRRPAQSKNSTSTNSSLPPLLPTSELASSPRKNVTSWPLTFAPTSPKRVPTDSIDLDPLSPISPKVRKLHARTRLLDDSRTRPALLQELLDYLHSELDGEREDATANTPSLRRLQIVREALNRLIDGFSVYAPVLMRIRDEYERAVEALHARSLMVPGLQTRLQSLETHCLRQLSACSAEAKARSLSLKKRLAETQALLAASAAENARLTAALKLEKEKVTKVESKLTEAQQSTLTLASSVRRHDESLRAGQERSLEDARALQKFDEQVRAAHNRNSINRTNSGSEITALSSTGTSLTTALERFLQRSRDNRADRVELVYNFLAGLERYNAQSSACRLFHLVYTQELPVEARSDQTRELAKLYEALAVVDRDRHFSNSSELDNSSTNSLSPGRVSLADVVRTLRLTFPWKSDEELRQLHRALIVDLRGTSQVDYTALLSHAHVNTAKPGGQIKWQFAECLKMQRLDDLLTFRRHVQRQIRSHVLPGDNSTTLPDDTETLMISLRDVRGCLYTADSAMSETEITRILGSVSGLSARELLTHDDMMLDTRQILQRLPTLLLKPTGRFIDLEV